jgi:DnaJ-domain-containing protein 1
MKTVSGKGKSRLPHAVELIIAALCHDLLGSYQSARRVAVAPSSAFSSSLELRMTHADLLVVEKFLQGKGSFAARRHGRKVNRRLIDALESAQLRDLVSAVVPWEMSALQVRRVAVTASRAQRTGTAPPEIVALFNAIENGLVPSYRDTRVRIPDMDEALMTCLRGHVRDDQWWAVRQFLGSNAGEDVYLHLRAALESGDPAHLRALFAPWWLSPTGTPTEGDAGRDSSTPDEPSSRSSGPQPCRPRRAGPDHYAALGVGRDAKGEEIRAAYKTLCHIYHPDRFQDASTAVVQEAEARMMALNDAYQCLSDEVLRAKYDSSARRP